jgi:hypothetical protein
VALKRIYSGESGTTSKVTVVRAMSALTFGMQVPLLMDLATCGITRTLYNSPRFLAMWHVMSPPRFWALALWNDPGETSSTSRLESGQTFKLSH